MGIRLIDAVAFLHTMSKNTFFADTKAVKHSYSPRGGRIISVLVASSADLPSKRTR